MWAILMLYALVWFYYLLFMRIKKTPRTVAEKQDSNMAAGLITVALTILAMSALFHFIIINRSKKSSGTRISFSLRFSAGRIQASVPGRRRDTRTRYKRRGVFYLLGYNSRIQMFR